MCSVKTNVVLSGFPLTMAITYQLCHSNSLIMAISTRKRRGFSMSKKDSEFQKVLAGQTGLLKSGQGLVYSQRLGTARGERGSEFLNFRISIFLVSRHQSGPVLFVNFFSLYSDPSLPFLPLLALKSNISSGLGP